MKKNAIIIAVILFFTACASHQGGYGTYQQRGSEISSPGQSTPLDATGASMNRFDATARQSRPQANVASERASGFTGQEGTASANTSTISPAGGYGSIDSEKSLRPDHDFKSPALARSENRPTEEFESGFPIPVQSNRDLGEQSNALNESADLHRRDSVGGPPPSETGRSSSDNNPNRYSEGRYSGTQIIPEKGDTRPGINDQSRMETPSDRELSDQVRSLLNLRTPGTLGTLSTAGMNNVLVSSRNGTVTLKGTVGSDAEKQDLESRVKIMPGVVAVMNQLRVNPDNDSNKQGYPIEK